MASVTYGGSKQPRGYGVNASRSLASLYGNQSMQPLSSSRPLQTVSRLAPPVSDVLNSAQVANRQRLAAITPPASTSATTPYDVPIAPNGGLKGTPGYTAPATSPAPSSTYQATDLSADPILNQIKALGQRRVGDAASGALAGAKNDLIGYGGVDVPQSLKDLFGTQTPTHDDLLGDLPGNSILAALNDQGTAASAAANPFSTKAQLAHAHDTNVHGLDQASNLANLYYSSTHANQLGDENNAYLGAQNSALQTLAQALLGENTGELNAINGAHDQYLGELPNAYQRALAAGGSGATGTAPPAADGGAGTVGPPTTNAAGYPANTSYADIGVTPSPVSSSAAAGVGFRPAPIAPPQFQDPLAGTNLLKLALAAYGNAGGQTGGNKPNISTVGRGRARAV